MTPDTLPIDVRIKGVGRIHRASGTADKVVRRKIVRMLKALRDAGRLDILRAIRDGHVTLLQVYDAAQRNALADLPIGNTMPLLSTAMRAWIEDARPDYSAKHIENHDYAQRQFEKEDKDARVADLPRLLEALRKTYGARHPRTFNIYRASALSFARATLKRSHPVYMACLAVEERAVPKRKSKPQLTVDAIRGFFPNPGENKVDRIAWAMVTTGMHAKEYWGEWHAEADRIHIGGTKRGGRVRDVPLIQAPALPPLSRDRFQRLFRERMRATGLTPYDLRRTYAQWLESAGIPRTRRKLYMGHGVKDVTDIYERHEVAAFLVADAKTLGAYLGITPPDAATKALEVMK
jgi:integrase